MRVVVTGATGNVGTSVIEALAAEPSVDRIVGLARRRPAWDPPKTSFETVDVRSSNLIEHFRGADAVVHLAWAFHPTHGPLKTWESNVLGSIRVFETAVRADVGAIVYASSVGAYSPGAGRHVDESWPTHGMPTAAYGREKAYLERYLDAFVLREPQIRVVRLRTAFVFQRQSASEQRRIFAGPLVPRGLVRPGRLPRLPVPAGLRFQALHGRDAGQAYRLAVVDDGASGPYNVAADPVIDASALADILGTRPMTVPPAAVRAALGVGWRLRLVPADEALLDMFLNLPTLDSSRIRRELGWSPRHTGVEALREMLNGLAEGAGGPTPPLQADRSTASQR
jgi:nucleoside-diphosphate-sugar epimerase